MTLDDTDPAQGRDPRRRRQRSDAALNRTKILETAAVALVETPNIAMGDLAELAGVSRNTIYRHFPSRDQLVDAVRRLARDDAEAFEDDALQPPGELANSIDTPLSITEVLNRVPPFQLGDQIVAEAQRIDGVASAALYLVDLDGASMQRIAGAGTFPATIATPLAVGPEIPREGVEPLRQIIDEVLPGAAVAPLFLRGRATGALLAIGPADDAIRDLAREAAIALGLSEHYTDAIERGQRLHDISPAAETQQILLPPRIVRITGATLAGNVLPGYEIGGDWFDYAENNDGTWIGIADVEGKSTYASGIAAVLLGAFRASRHRDQSPAGAVHLMHDVLRSLPGPTITATTTIASWNAATSMLRWTTCGEISPMLIGPDGGMTILDEVVLPRLGAPDLPDDAPVQHRRIEPGERVLLLSDGLLGRRTVNGDAIGTGGVHAAAIKAHSTSAAGTVRAIEDLIRENVVDPLDDDATLVVLARTPTPADTEDPNTNHEPGAEGATMRETRARNPTAPDAAGGTR